MVKWFWAMTMRLWVTTEPKLRSSGWVTRTWISAVLKALRRGGGGSSGRAGTRRVESTWDSASSTPYVPPQRFRRDRPKRSSCSCVLSCATDSLMNSWKNGEVDRRREFDAVAEACSCTSKIPSSTAT